MNIGKIIYGLLSADADVSAIVGTRIFPDLIPQETSFPAICFQLIGANGQETKDGPSNVNFARVQVDYYGTTYDQAQDLAEKGRQALEWKQGTIAGESFERIKHEDTRGGMPNPDLAVFWVSQDFTVRVLRA